MGVFENKEIRGRLCYAFPALYINHNNECIIYPKRNTYFSMDGVGTETDLIAKVLEWLSREAAKSLDPKSQVYHLNGINQFLGTNFTKDEMATIYTWLGNCCNHDRTLGFIESGYDLAILS